MKLKYWNNSICTYMKSKEKSVYDKWVCFKNTQNAKIEIYGKFRKIWQKYKWVNKNM